MNVFIRIVLIFLIVVSGAGPSFAWATPQADTKRLALQKELEVHLGLSLDVIGRSAIGRRVDAKDRTSIVATLRSVGTSKYFDELKAHHETVIGECVAGGLSKSACESIQSDLSLRVQFTEKIRNIVERDPQNISHEAVALGIMSLSSRADEFLLPKYVAWRKSCENNQAVNSSACRDVLGALVAVRERLRASEELAVARVNGNVIKTIEARVKGALQGALGGG